MYRRSSCSCALSGRELAEQASSMMIVLMVWRAVVPDGLQKTLARFHSIILCLISRATEHNDRGLNDIKCVRTRNEVKSKQPFRKTDA